MISLRWRIVLGTIVATSAVVLVSAGAAWFAVRLAMLRQADRTLTSLISPYLVPPRDPGGTHGAGARGEPGRPRQPPGDQRGPDGPWDGRPGDGRPGDGRPGDGSGLPAGPGPRDRRDGPDPRDQGTGPGPRPDGRPPRPEDGEGAPGTPPDGGTAGHRGPPPRPNQPPPPREERIELVQLIGIGGRVLMRSAALREGEDLATAGPPGWLGQPLTVTLASGRVVRVARATTALPAAPDGSGPPTIYAATDLGRAQDELARLADILLLLWLGATLLAVGVSIALQRSILRPVERISLAITALGPERLSQRITDDVAPRELLPIVGQLNYLMARLEGAFNREKMTIANIAHELRTPVASLRCTLEFALAAGQPELERVIAERCLAVTLDLQRMITNLLALARIEAGLEQVVLRPVDLPGLLARSWAPLEAEAARRRLTLAGLERCAGHTLSTCPDKARLVLGNLLENAVTYATPGSAIRLSLAVAGGRATLAIENDTDADHQPPPLDRICQPFVRGDAARTGGDHAGLGLTLVSRLMPHLDGAITISQPTATVFRVAVGFPTAEPPADGTDAPPAT